VARVKLPFLIFFFHLLTGIFRAHGEDSLFYFLCVHFNTFLNTTANSLPPAVSTHRSQLHITFCVSVGWKVSIWATEDYLLPTSSKGTVTHVVEQLHFLKQGQRILAAIAPNTVHCPGYLLLQNNTDCKSNKMFLVSTTKGQFAD